MKTNEKFFDVNPIQQKNPWGSDNYSGLGMVSFNFLFLGGWLNYILGLVDVQVLRGVQSQNTETIKHQML